MFENILAQARVIDDLKQSITEDTVPGSILFHGPKYTGKTTTALEFARVFTCMNHDALWGCSCRACREQRLLIHGDVKLLGPGAFMPEMLAASDALRRTPSVAARYLFIRSVRKILRRLDSDLWDDSDKKHRSAQSSIEFLCDLLDSISPKVDENQPAVGEKFIEKAVEAASKLVEIIPRDSVPVDQIRRLSRWAHRTTGGRSKIAIITQAERMADSARNALLKTLEEPPEHTFFILTTTTPEALIPTIRSRLRPYKFAERSRTDAKSVLERIFRENAEYDSLSDYFLAWDVPPELLKNETAAFVEAVVADSYEKFFDDNRDLDQLTSDREVFLSFLAQLMSYLMNHDTAGYSQAERTDFISQVDAWNREVRATADGVRRYNLSPTHALDTLFYKLRRIT